jgi:hypothetical protein
MDNKIKLLIDALKSNIEIHEKENFTQLKETFDKIFNELGTLFYSENINEKIAFNFLDSWYDASNHDWLFYEGIEKDDWPSLARIIIKCLETDEEITNPIILNNFARVNTFGFFAKLKKLILG